MTSVVFKSKSRAKLELLIRVANEMGVETSVPYELNEDDMALPGSKVSETQLEEWLKKGDGDGESSTEEMLNYVKAHIGKSRKLKNAGRLQTARKKGHS